MSRRQSARLKQAASPASTATPSTGPSTPLFSNNPSVSSQSDVEDDELLLPATKPAGKKRKSGENLEEKVETCPKKRALDKSMVYIEVPSPTVTSGKGKAKAILESDSEDEKPLAQTTRLQRKTSQKATTKISPRNGKKKAQEQSDEEIISDNEEDEHNENASLQESEDSGSEFEGSQMEDSESEALMVTAAIQQSLTTLEEDVNGAGSSKGPRSQPAISKTVRRKARAAEKRVTRARASAMDEDFEELGEPPESESDASLESSSGEDSSQDEIRPTRAPRRRTARGGRRTRKPKLSHAEKTTIALHQHHPELRDIWGDLERTVPVIEPERAEQPANLKVTLLPFQQESLFWMRKQENTEWKGGMLADEMGMGKTIQIISLLVTDLKRPNLVVAPTVAVMQWKNELDAHTENIKVLVWHGSSRETNIKELQKYDVVLTTYAVMESCYRKQEYGFKRKDAIVKEKSPIHQIKWNRIVLDEAHNIKERSTNTARAAFELKSSYKWCLSGTPLQNRVGELYSLIRFLGGDPFSYYFCKLCDCKSLHWRFENHKTCKECGHNPMQHTCLWNHEILTPIQKHGVEGPGAIAFKKLRSMLDRMMLRRTKIQRADDLGLPPRTVIVRRDYFSPEEKELYLSLFSDAKRQFNTYLDHGTVLNNYSNIFSLLTRMRQMACHPDLVLRSKANQAKFVPDEGEAIVCRLCNDIAEDAIQAQCRHVFDRECIKQYLNTAVEQTPACPVCHVRLTIDLEATAIDLECNAAVRQGILGRLNLDNWRSSTKIEALLEVLSNLRLNDATTKTIVFSQFVNFLDLVAFRLQKAGFNICRLEGSMSPQARDATIQHFMKNVDVTVFLVSLKAGGVALNLTEASRVVLCDSWWNPAVEFQAMDRIHRLGQKRPVEAIKLVVEDSIESRIIQLQEKKSAMVDATLSTDDQAMGRLTPEDLSFLFRL